jgi:hypothetical protein
MATLSNYKPTHDKENGPQVPVHSKKEKVVGEVFQSKHKNIILAEILKHEKHVPENVKES